MGDSYYSTTLVAEPRRFDYWKEVVLRHCIPAASKPLTAEAFDGRLEVHELGALDICSLSAPWHYWERTPKHLRSGPDDDLWIGLCRSGRAELEQGGRTAKPKSDQIFLYDADQTFRFSLGGQHQLLRIPRHLLTARLPGVEKLAGLTLDERRPGVVPLREMLRYAADNPADLLNAEIASRFTRTLLDLLTLSLECQDLEKVSAERDLYARAMNYILRHLNDPELCVERIARHHHVSVRTVTRAFARHQKTPAAAIWQERLQASRQAIENGQGRSVSQVALDHGFSDFSHFSHAFRKAFGVSPQTLLRRH